MAAMNAPPPADIEDAVDMVLGLMSCMHPRPLGEADPTAAFGVSDLARPYAASVGSWSLDELSADTRATIYMCPHWPAHASRLVRTAGARTLLLHDGETLMIPRAQNLVTADDNRSIEATELTVAPEQAPTVLLDVALALVSEGEEQLPTMLYVRIKPAALLATEEALEPAIWAQAADASLSVDEHHPTELAARQQPRMGMEIGEHGKTEERRPRWRRRVRLLVPLAHALAGEASISLEPPANDHGFAPSAVPSVSVRWLAGASEGAS